jgi:hypothetical protein
VDAVALELGLTSAGTSAGAAGSVAMGGLLPADKEAFVRRLQEGGARVSPKIYALNPKP